MLRTLNTSNRRAVASPNSRKLFSIVFAVFVLGTALPCFAQSTYFVDPDYTGGMRNGSGSNPWRSLSDTVTNTPWTVINTALASGPVTVYFLARKATSNTNQTSTGQLSIQRSNTSA